MNITAGQGGKNKSWANFTRIISQAGDLDIEIANGVVILQAGEKRA